MAKQKIIYSCQNCGFQSPKWLGKCQTCGEWNSFIEETLLPHTDGSSLSDVREEFKSIVTSETSSSVSQEGNWVELDTQVGSEQNLDATQRLFTGYSELDRVLGGGLIPDSFTLLGGDPGIGKSTLLLQMANGICKNQESLRLLYASGEESIPQIRGRAKRLGVQGNGKIFLAAETQLERVFGLVKELRPNVLIIDSLQTFSTGFVQAAPGSVGQVREIAARLMTLAKTAKISVWLVGHVTKEGSIAGPKTVEHMVDTVLYFEGEGGQSYRLLRTIKNRFGSTRELGVFEMEGEGLREVTNPSSLFLTERNHSVSGTAITTPLEGSRPLLVELQALVTASGLAMPRRTSVGIDSTRVSLIAAILEKHIKLSLAAQDLFFNVSGGLKLSDPACDLAIAAAIWSSNKELALPMRWVFLGELGLTGEVRPVSQSEIRIQEAKRLGFETIVLPKGTPKATLEKLRKENSIKVITVADIREFCNLFK